MLRRVALLCVLALGAVACSAPGDDSATSAQTDAALRSDTASETPPAAGAPTPTATEAPAAEVDPILAMELVDVRTGEPFTLAELAAEKPVLVETMAIWCQTCRSQQREVVRAHEVADFHSVGIDVDPNERADDLADYAEREGFDWRFVMADAELVQLLTDRYGFGVTNPPSTPTFIVSADGQIRALEFGRVRPADELVAELEAS